MSRDHVYAARGVALAVAFESESDSLGNSDDNVIARRSLSLDYWDGEAAT
jgi:hypothetical protein